MQGPIDLPQTSLQFGLLGPEGGRVDVPGDAGIEEAVAGALDFGLLSQEIEPTAAAAGRPVGNGFGEALAEPLGHLLGGHPQFLQLRSHGLLEVPRSPPYDRVVWPAVVLGAPVVDVVADRAVGQRPADAFAGDRCPADGAPEEAAGKLMLWVGGPTGPAVEDLLAGVEELLVDQRLVFAGIGLAAPLDLADVEAVPEDVGEGGARKARLGRPVDAAFLGQRVPQGHEVQRSLGIQQEDADDGGRLLGVGLDRLLTVARDVDVAVRGMSREPPLADLLVHALSDLGLEVLAVVLGDRGHHIERELASRTGAELVLDEQQPDAAGILEFLKSHGVPQVPADAVEFVAEDGLDALLASVLLDPGEHAVELSPGGTALRRLGDRKLANDLPLLPFGLPSTSPELGVDGVAFLLFPR